MKICIPNSFMKSEAVRIMKLFSSQWGFVRRQYGGCLAARQEHRRKCAHPSASAKKIEEHRRSFTWRCWTSHKRYLYGRCQQPEKERTERTQNNATTIELASATLVTAVGGKVLIKAAQSISCVIRQRLLFFIEFAFESAAWVNKNAIKIITGDAGDRRWAPKLWTGLQNSSFGILKS